jgi:hypothetical protein
MGSLAASNYMDNQIMTNQIETSTATHHQQLTLPVFGPPLTSSKKANPRHHQVRLTSREAYQSSQPRAGTKQARVLDALRDAGRNGATIWQLHERTGIMYSSLPACTGALIDRGLVSRTDRTRETGNGGRGYVLVASPFTAEAHDE